MNNVGVQLLHKNLFLIPLINKYRALYYYGFQSPFHGTYKHVVNAHVRIANMLHKCDYENFAHSAC